MRWEKKENCDIEDNNVKIFYTFKFYVKNLKILLDIFIFSIYQVICFDTYIIYSLAKCQQLMSYCFKWKLGIHLQFI